VDDPAVRGVRIRRGDEPALPLSLAARSDRALHPDLPTQLGYDSDDPRATGEVGRTGVAIDSIADMELLFDQIPLAEVSTSMTINAPASSLLLLYELVAEEQELGRPVRGR
jgi:methylmalonyl-CoA mutase N-terminal domain/subunit